MKSVSLRIAFTCVSLAILSHSLLAAEPAAKPVAIGFQNRVFTDAAGQKHPFVLFVPAKADPSGKPPSCSSSTAPASAG